MTLTVGELVAFVMVTVFVCCLGFGVAFFYVLGSLADDRLRDIDLLSDDYDFKLAELHHENQKLAEALDEERRNGRPSFRRVGRRPPRIRSWPPTVNGLKAVMTAREIDGK